MKVFNKKLLTRWSVALTTVLFLASCGGDNDDAVATIGSGATPISTGSATAPGPTSTGMTAGVALPSNTFATTLTGAQEVPPVTTNATGTGVVVIDPDTLVMKATIVTGGINGNAAHIHVGPLGTAGPIVFPLTQTSAGSGIWTTQATLTAAQLNELRIGNYYFNVHSAPYPNGEIRGQILQGASTGISSATGAAGTATTQSGATGTSTSMTGTTGTGSSGAGTIGTGTTGTGATATGSARSGINGTGTTTSVAFSGNAFVVGLTGTQEVPPVTTSAIGVGIVVVDPDSFVMRTAIVTRGLNGNAAHIHVGSLGVAGPIVFPLFETSADSGIWAAQSTLTAVQLNALRAGNYYFNVRSAAYQNGEIRGQILLGSSTGVTSTSTTSTTGADTDTDTYATGTS